MDREKTNKLSHRLEGIISLVEPTHCIADIGTDHGYIPVELIMRDYCDWVIATDINSGPLLSAANYINAKEMNEEIDLLFGDGLQPLSMEDVDTFIIAGMGGLLIQRMIEDKLDEVNSSHTFILQPMNAANRLRGFLYLNGFKFIDERIVKEGHHYYEMFKVIWTGVVSLPLDPIYYEFSPILLERKDPLLSELIQYRMSINHKIIQDLTLKGKAKEKRAWLIEKNTRMEALLDEYHIRKMD